MKAEYFPKTPEGYRYFFDIALYERCLKLGSRRIDELKTFDQSNSDVENMEKLLKECKLFQERLQLIIDGKGVDSSDDFYDAYNTLLLINASIEQNIIDKVLTKEYKKLVKKKRLKEQKDKLLNVGYALYPHSSLLESFASHAALLMALLWIAAQLLLYFTAGRKIESFGDSVSYVLGTCVLGFTPMFLVNKWVDLFRNSRIMGIQYRCRYSHRFRNRDFLSDNAVEVIKAKISK